MIHPNMATMLSVITTDAAVAPDVWRRIMKQGAENSFNQARASNYVLPCLCVFTTPLDGLGNVAE